MTPKKAKITPAEWEIMEAIWSLGKSKSVREVMEHAYPHGEKAYTTVQTLMNLLTKKGLLSRKKIGMVNFYTPTRTRKEMVKKETQSLVSRVFNGSAPALASFLIDQEDLDMEEIQKIKNLLDEKEKKLRGQK